MKTGVKAANYIPPVAVETPIELDQSLVDRIGRFWVRIAGQCFSQIAAVPALVVTGSNRSRRSACSYLGNNQKHKRAEPKPGTKSRAFFMHEGHEGFSKLAKTPFGFFVSFDLIVPS